MLTVFSRELDKKKRVDVLLAERISEDLCRDLLLVPPASTTSLHLLLRVARACPSLRCPSVADAVSEIFRRTVSALEVVVAGRDDDDEDDERKERASLLAVASDVARELELVRRLVSEGEDWEAPRLASIFDSCLTILTADSEDRSWTRPCRALLRNASRHVDSGRLKERFGDLLDGNGSLESKVDAVCQLADRVFGATLLDDRYFRVLQGGLVCKTSLTRKQSMYLLKRTVEAVSNGTCRSSSRLLDADSSGNRQWDDFFLVMETVDEKQVHIIRQIVAKLQGLSDCRAKGKEGGLHLSWYLLLFKLLFGHQNGAVVKWSLQYFLKTFRGSFTVGDDLASFVGTSLFEALNTTKLYERHLTPKVKEGLVGFLAECLMQCSSQAERDDFLNRLLDSFIATSWGPIPLFHVSHAVRLCICSAGDKFMKGETARRLSDFVAYALRCQEPLLRCGTMCNLLSILTSGSSPELLGCDFLTASAHLKAFHGPGRILLHGTRSWKDARAWLNSGASIRSPPWRSLWEEASTSGETLRCMALGMAIVLDADCFMSELVVSMQDDVFDSTCRPYVEGIGTKVRFLLELVAAFGGPSRREGRDFLCYGSGQASPTLVVQAELDGRLSADLVEPLWRMFRQGPEEESRSAQDLLAHVAKGDKEVFAQISRDCLEMAVDGQAPVGLRTRSLELLCEALNYCAKADDDVVIKGLHPIVLLRSGFPIPAKAGSHLEVSRNLSLQWRLLRKLLESGGGGGGEGVLDVERRQCMLESATEAVSSVEGSALPSVLETITFLIEAASSIGDSVEPAIPGILKAGLVSVFEQRKNDTFWPAVKAAVNLICLDRVVHSEDEAVQASVSSCLADLLAEAEAVPGIAATVALALSKTTFGEDERVQKRRLPPCLLSHVGALLTFGPLFRRDLQLVMDSNAMVLAEEDEVFDAARCVEGSDHLVASLARATMLNLVSRLRSQGAVSDVVESVSAQEAAVASGKKRYFANSLVHLTKHRALQVLLVLTPAMGPPVAAAVFQRLVTSLIKESMEPSVRYLTEWTLTKILLRHWDGLREAFQEAFLAARKARLSCVPSFLAVRAFVALSWDGGRSQQEEQVSEALGLLAPWCMAQHFATRSCAQTFVRKLHLLASRNHPDLAREYSLLAGMVESCFGQGDQEKNERKIQEDFYLSEFDPVRCFNPRDIFKELPRLCGLVRQEWENADAYTSLEWDELSRDEGVLGSIPGGMEVKELEMEVTEASEAAIIQKKITPWKSMLEQSDSNNNDDDDDDRTPAAFPHLRVVASLIDKLPNLGGLCRTCEVFGAGELALPSGRAAAQQELRSVSVTAHGVLARSGRLTEVPPAELADYLSRRRAEGYSVVAAEQATGSRCLGGFRFPQKTVLLLGNEREGLPPELLAAVDYCVEVPQRGVVRSLNVHVTGAIIIWEYVRQWSLGQNGEK